MSSLLFDDVPSSANAIDSNFLDRPTADHSPVLFCGNFSKKYCLLALSWINTRGVRQGNLIYFRNLFSLLKFEVTFCDKFFSYSYFFLWRPQNFDEITHLIWISLKPQQNKKGQIFIGMLVLWIFISWLLQKQDSKNKHPNKHLALLILTELSRKHQCTLEVLPNICDLLRKS